MVLMNGVSLGLRSLDGVTANEGELFLVSDRVSQVITIVFLL